MLIEQLQRIVGTNACVSDETDLAPHLTDWRGIVHGRTPLMVMPGSTVEVSAVVKACAHAGVGLVPQGGNTGMCAGAVPDGSGEQIIVNLSRLNRIRSLDAEDFSVTVEAGCVLATVQDAARRADRYFPLSLGAEGSCQIGGNLSTDAGGINVIRYGTARDLVLGLEVVLADGTIWDGVKTLRKDTAGYDLKHLFVGSEGTLGIITAAALKLFPPTGPTTTAMVAIEKAGDAVALLGELRKNLADRIEAFELIGASAFGYVLQHLPTCRSPFSSEFPWYVIIDAAVDPEKQELERLLLMASEKGTIKDAAIAKNIAEADGFWRLRHSISEAEKKVGVGLKHDISVPIGRMQEFLIAGEQRLSEQVPQAELVAFGHVGDGNLHYNVHLPSADSKVASDALRRQTSDLIYQLVTEMGGSISAEHGVGVLKKAALETYQPDVDLALMRSLKRTLDPHNILNPGKVI